MSWIASMWRSVRPACGRAASSRGHDQQYTVAHEDLTAAGGAVFSVDSKSWCASLSWNGYDNDFARVSENVLRRFMATRADRCRS